MRILAIVLTAALAMGGCSLVSSKKDNGTGDKCDDNICQTDESCSSCPADCGQCDTTEADVSGDTHTEVSPDGQGEICGNAVCVGTETCETCSEDCGPCDPSNSCTDTSECADTTVCVGGTCLPAVGHGEPCAGTAQCSESAVCTPVSQSFGLCLYSDITTGGLCWLSIECESEVCINGTCGCGINEQCETDQYCDATTGICGEQLASGSSCLDPSWCLSEVCVAGQCGCDANNVCLEGTYCETTISLCASYFLPGMACVENGNCASGSCVDNLCSCVGNEDCDAGTYCDAKTGSCELSLGAGADCSADAMCQSGQCLADLCACVEDDHCGEGQLCDVDTSSCVASLTVGSACGADTQCLSGLCIGGNCGCASSADCVDGDYCAASGQCTAPALLGGACEDVAGSCASGDCVDETCVCTTDAACGADSWCLAAPGVCLPAKPPGGSCDTDATCLSGSCDCGTGNGYCCCTSDDQCNDGQHCTNDGACQSVKWGGVPCASGNECKAGVCNKDTCGCVEHTDCVVFHYCVIGVCESQEGMGNACTTSAQCTTGNCQDDVCACTPGGCSNKNYCDTGDGKCITKHATGEECAADEQCKTGKCVEGACICTNSLEDCYSGNGVQIYTYCHPVTQQCVKKGYWGEPCVENAGCLTQQCTPDGYCACSTAFNWCGSGYFCETTHWLCQPTGGPGDACVVNGECSSFDCTDEGYCACDTEDCGEDQYCNEASGLCAPELILGAVCASDIECGSGSCNGLICGCSADNDCPANQFCGGAPNGTCQAKGAPGDSCTAPAMCLSAKCTGNLCRCVKESHCPESGDYCDAATGFCVLQGELGDFCESGAMCQSGRCENKACACAQNDQCTDLEFCELTTGFCVPKGISGSLLPAPCNDDEQCLGGNCIEGAAGLKKGYCGCAVDDDCLKAQWCCADVVLCSVLPGLFATCLPKGEFGMPCGDDGHCKSDHCLMPAVDFLGQCGCDSNSACLESQFCNLALQICGVKAKLLQPCLQNSHCESGYCIPKMVGGLSGKGPSVCGCDDNSDCLDNQVCDNTSHLCAECTKAGDCDDDEFCDLPPALPLVPAPTAGACWDKLNLGNFCAGDSECKSNYCKEVLDMPGDSIGLCMCNNDADCVGEGIGEFCDNGLCVQKYLVGGVCTDDEQCASGDCGKIAGNLGTCQCTNDLHCTNAIKTPCFPEGIWCKTPYCNDNNGGCVQCAEHDDCDEGNYCSASNSCKNKGLVGSPCNDDVECVHDTCMNAPLGPVCVLPYDNSLQKGAACTSNSQCESGKCYLVCF